MAMQAEPHQYPGIDFTDLAAMPRAATTAQVEAALAGRLTGLAALAALLSPPAGAMLPRLAQRSAAITRQRFGRTMGIYAPLYLHNYCVNRCAYCGFAAGNPIHRRALSLAEIEAEAAILARRGIQHLLLVTGEAEAKADVDFLCTVARRLAPGFAALSVEVQPLDQAGYERLFAAGITGVTIYQETYDPQVYRQVHLAGPKTDYHWRLATPARAAAAGMREVGIGALLGLADWRGEGMALGAHLAWLRKRYWRTGFTVSFPRLRPAAGGFAPLSPVGEAELVQLIFALRIFDPDVGLVLSTREDGRFRDGMIGLGPTRYSAGSCTAPGGYLHPDPEGEQFSIGDHRTVAEVCAAIEQRGFDPVRKDWDPVFQGLADAA